MTVFVGLLLPGQTAARALNGWCYTLLTVGFCLVMNCSLLKLSLHVGGLIYSNSTLSPSSTVWPVLPSNSRTVSLSRTACSAQTANPFRTLTHTETVIVPVPTITTVYFEMLDEMIPATLHTHTLTGPTTFITTIADPVEIYHGKGDCCGPCNIYFPTVALYYWPVASPNTSCLDHHQTSSQITARAYNLPTNSSVSKSYAVGLDGFTYISPSVYVVFGDVTAGNMCGTVGAVHSSVTLAFAPGELSTYDWRGGARAFDPNDMPCGPDQPFYFGPKGIQAVNKGAVYKPTINMPEKLKGLDPAWASCASDYYEGIDPPHPLTAAAAMDPAITAAGPPPIAPPAAPHSTLNAPPVKTGIEGTPDPSPAKDSGSPTAPGSDIHASSAVVLSSSHRDDLSTAPSTAVGGPPASTGVDPPSLVNGDPKVESKPAVADPISSNGPPAPSPLADVGSHAGNAVGVSTADPATDPQVSSGGGHSQAPARQTGQPAASNSAGTTPVLAVLVQGHTIADNSPPVTIGGKAVGFSSGHIYFGGNVAPAPTYAPQQSSITVFQGLTFSPLPFNDAATLALPIAIVDGKTITAAGSSGKLCNRRHNSSTGRCANHSCGNTHICRHRRRRYRKHYHHNITINTTRQPRLHRRQPPLHGESHGLRPRRHHSPTRQPRHHHLRSPTISRTFRSPAHRQQHRPPHPATRNDTPNHTRLPNLHRELGISVHHRRPDSQRRWTSHHHIRHRLDPRAFRHPPHSHQQGGPQPDCTATHHTRLADRHRKLLVAIPHRRPDSRPRRSPRHRQRHPYLPTRYTLGSHCGKEHGDPGHDCAGGLRWRDSVRIGTYWTRRADCYDGGKRQLYWNAVRGEYGVRGIYVVVAAAGRQPLFGTIECVVAVSPSGLDSGHPRSGYVPCE